MAGRPPAQPAPEGPSTAAESGPSPWLLSGAALAVVGSVDAGKPGDCKPIQLSDDCVIYDHGTTNVDNGIGSVMEMHLFGAGLAATGRLDALSPLRQLERGFVIASRERDGAGLRSTESLNFGDPLWLRFSRGRAAVRVEDVEN